MKTCINCPGSSDHNTADCPLMRAPAHIEDGEEVEVVERYRAVLGGLKGLAWERLQEFSLRPSVHAEVVELMTVAQHQRIVAALIKKANRYDWLRSQQIMLPGHDFLSTGEILDQRIDDKLPAQTADAPYAAGIADDLERSDWTPEEALRWYASGRHFDVVDGRTRIIDTGAVASNALKHASLAYLELKGDAELTELREKVAPPAAGVPDGWKLVPMEPTEAMLSAGALAIHRKRADMMSPTPTEFHEGGEEEAFYRSVLAAAPTPPASEQQRAVVLPAWAEIDEEASELAKNGDHGWNAYKAELLRLNPHLAKGEGV